MVSRDRNRDSSQHPIVQLEQRLRRMHEGRVEELRTARLVRDMDESASLPPDSKITTDLVKRISNHPQNYWDWAVSSLSNQPFKYRVPPNIAGSKDSAGKVEKQCYGFDAQINSNIVDGHWEHKLANQVVGGSFSFMPDLVMSNGALIATMEFYDPATVFWDWDRFGVRNLVISASAPLYAIREHIESNQGSSEGLRGDDGDFLTFIDAWQRKGNLIYNTYMVEGREYLPTSLQPAWQRVPVLVGTVNGRGNEMWETSYVDRASRNSARSILAPIIDTYRQYNEWRTFARERARYGLAPGLFTRSKDGQAVLEPGDFRPGKSAIIPLKEGEDIKTIDMGSAPFDVQKEQEIDRQEMEEGSISSSSLGQNRPQLSSALLQAQLEVQQNLRQGPYARAYNMAAEMAMLQLVRKMKTMKASVHLAGQHLEVRGMDGFFEEDFSWKDIPKYYQIKVWHEPLRAVDKQGVVATEGMQLERGAISLRTYQENTGVEDPDGERLKREEEEIQEFPLVKQSRTLIAMLKDAKETRAMAAKARTKAEKDLLLLQARAEELTVIQESAKLKASLAEVTQGQPGRNASQPNALPPGERKPPPFLETPQARDVARMRGTAKVGPQ